MIVSLVKFFDLYLGTLLIHMLAAFRQKSGSIPKNPQKLLIIQLWGIGETILTLPAVNSLKQKFPNSEITILATSRNKDVYYGIKGIKLITIKLNPFSIKLFILKNLKRYDLAIDMEEYLNVSSIISFFTAKSGVGYSHNARAKLYSKIVVFNDRQHQAETFLDLVRALGVSSSPEILPKLNYSPGDSAYVEEFLKKNLIGKNDVLIGIAPGAAESAKSRMWPLENYIQLIDGLTGNHNARIVLIGSENETELSGKIMGKSKNKNVIDSMGKLNLRQLFCLMEKLKLFIGNDSGPMHIAAAQGVRTIGLFGPNLPVRFAPYGKNNASVYKGQICEFSPCINVHKGQVPDCLYARDSDDYQKCMKNIEVGDVLKVVQQLV